MKISKEKIWRSAQRALKRTKSYQNYREMEENYELVYVLIEGKYPCGNNVAAVAVYENVAILFYPYGNREELELWGFNLERDLFECLQEGDELAGMSMKSHAVVWDFIDKCHEDIESEKGMQKYLGYCKQNGVTRERLEKEVNYSGKDVMVLYAPKVNRTKKQKDRER